MAAVELRVAVVPGEIRSGGWCERCALPSLVEMDVYALSGQGRFAGVTKVKTIRRCANHDVEEVR